MRVVVEVAKAWGSGQVRDWPGLSRGQRSGLNKFPVLTSRHRRRSRLATATLAGVLAACVVGWPSRESQAAEEGWSAGVATVDITPDYPVRLGGFGFRRTESEGVRLPIAAQALALKFGDGPAAVLLTVDNLGVSDAVTTEVGRRLQRQAGLDPQRLAITFTHTHTAPMLTGVTPTLFSLPIPPEHQAHIDQYTRELTDKLEQVALAALRDLQPARLAWGIGQVDLAVNRRTKGGPVDHDLPVLVVRNSENKIRAIYVNYACHCVTLSENRIGGDWAGYAREQIEKSFPGAVALFSIGCGADSNPRSGVTGDKWEVAQSQGVEMATAVGRVLQQELKPVQGPLDVRYERIDLAFDKLPTREELAAVAEKQDAAGYHARVQQARLERGEALRTKISYPVQTWSFGSSLALVFLPGEVVVDYALRLKHDLDGSRLWINSYSNDAPCYIPSERILKEGGYEGGVAMIYYDQPTKFASGLEQQIVGAVQRQIGQAFAAPPEKNRAASSATQKKAPPAGPQGAHPKSPAESLQALRTHPGLQAELVASEPQVTSPVAIDFGPDGKIWVAEMYDYPLGLDGNYQPGGRVRLLESTRSDGRFDKSTVFLEGIPFPTGVTVWRKGVLVCAAPDILYAEDTNGDGKADIIRKLFSGFGTENFQARVNSLEYGLDGWVYGSCGLFGGRITNDAGKPPVVLGDRDFRIKPDEGLIEAASGRTQQGRVRDDWGNWFGCNNSAFALHYPLADHDLRRNPHFAPEVTVRSVPDGGPANRLFPASTQLQMFKLSGPTGQATAACGLGIYRDDLLGADYAGNVFTCEPVNLVVHRLRLEPRGYSFAGHRAPGEEASEVVASTDTWFRPVQVRTGPDGGLWIVDMYRYVIEHPRWIPPEDLAQLDTRAGHDRGRIYRVKPAERDLRNWPRLDRLDAHGLAQALDSPNGWQRDMALQMLIWSQGQAGVPDLERLAREARRPQTRLAALCALDGLGALPGSLLRDALRDEHPGVRRHAARLAQAAFASDAQVGPLVTGLLNDADAQVRLQAATSLGAWHDPRAGTALAGAVARQSQDPIFAAAVMSSLHADNIEQVVTAFLGEQRPADLPVRRLEQLFGIAAALAPRPVLAKLLTQTCAARGPSGAIENWQLVALAGIYDALSRRGWKISELLDDAGRAEQAKLYAAVQRELRGATPLPDARRVAGIRLLGYGLSSEFDATSLTALASVLTPDSSPAVQTAAIGSVARLAGDRAAAVLTEKWRSYTPSLKSQVIEVLLGRDSWQTHLLQTVPASDIDATRRQRLLSSRNQTVRSLAAEKFAGAPSADRKQVLESYRDVATLRGDREWGRAVFVKNCSVCHELQNVGHDVGPDLGVVINKTPQYLLQEILDPNRNVDSRFVTYVAVTKDGRTHTGLLAAESTGSITLKSQEAKQETILRSEIEELQSTGLSLMPVGLEKDLSKQNLADVLAYLASIGFPPKIIAGNQPDIVRGTEARFALTASTAEIYGDDITFETPFQNIGFWHGARDHVVWTLEVESAGMYDVWLDWACADDSAGNAYVLAAGADELRSEVRGTGGWDKYRQEKVGRFELPAGPLRLSLRPAAPPRGALADLRGIYLVPPGQKPQLALAKPALPAAAPQTPAQIAAQLLDGTRPEAEREALVRDHLDRAADIIVALTTDLPNDEKEEYRRIPWIWRVAIAAGKQNDTTRVRQVLEVSLPRLGQPLRDWQAVVVGGGLINAFSQLGIWPDARLRELVKDSADLEQRWKQVLSQAVTMADDAKINTGTRYDALRIVPLSGWKASGAQLQKYLQRGVHDELQMGAISGSSDVDVPEVPRLLAAGVPYFNAENRGLAIDALLRTPARAVVLVEALEAGTIQPAHLTAAQAKQLLAVKDDALRARAEKAFRP
ncbi:MAG: HEAT repeat domain-containing protein [Planctomycetes bacterium]|nr:HEAT repeat domain-containing protein [Planctomycetota bacterium]